MEISFDLTIQIDTFGAASAEDKRFGHATRTRRSPKRLLFH